MASKRTDFFNGNKGELWIAGVLIGTCSKCKITKKINYEEIPAPTGNGFIRVPASENYEISASFRSNGEEYDIDMFNLNEDISLIASNSNIADSSRRRVRCDGVTFDEQTLIDFEKHKVQEIELNGQAESAEILE